MPGKKRDCTCCQKFMRSDNLKNHMKKCIGSDQSPFLPKRQVSTKDHDLFDKIINGRHRSQPTKMKEDKVISVNLPDLNVSPILKPEV